MTIRRVGLLIFTFFLVTSAAGTASAICRALGPGDKYYPRYTHCCDGRGGSFWTHRNGNRRWWRGTCYSWGIRANRPVARRVCRDLRRGEPYFNGWKRCCDTADGGSIWTRRWGGGATIKYPGRTCASYGIR